MKLYYEAIKSMPEHFIDDNTRACLWCEDAVIAMNPKFPPMKYTNKLGLQEIKISDNPFKS